MKAHHALAVAIGLAISSLGSASQVHAQAASGDQAGGKGNAGQAQHQAKSRPAAGRGEEPLSKLDLSTDQQQRVQAVRGKYRAQMHPAGGKRLGRAEMQKLRQQEDAEIAQILNPDQRAKWEQLKSERTAKPAHPAETAHPVPAGNPAK